MSLRMKLGYVFSILAFFLIGYEKLVEVWSKNLVFAASYCFGIWIGGFIFGNILGLLVGFIVKVANMVRGKN